MNSDQYASMKMFQTIQEAYLLLSDPTKRKEWDLQHSLEQENVCISIEMDLSDMQSDMHGRYTIPCRCGEHFELTTQDLEPQCCNLIECEGCSLVIGVNY